VALLVLAVAARAEVFTNYTLYGWSSPAWPSDTTNAMRGSVIRMPAYVRANGTNGGINTWTAYTTNGAVVSGTNYWSFDPIEAWPRSIGGYTYVASNNAAAFWFNTKDRRAYERFLALYERAAAIPVFSYLSGSGSAECDDFAPSFYRWEHDNLVECKKVIRDLAGDYARVPDATNALLAEALPFSNDGGATLGDGAPFSGRLPTFSIPRWTARALCAAAGAPSNWCEYTPWRQIDGNGTNGVGRVSTQSWTIATTYTSAVERLLFDFWGGYTNVLVTNGQVVSVVVTNTDIEDGFTHLDYGDKRAERIISLLAWPVMDDVRWVAQGKNAANAWAETGVGAENIDEIEAPVFACGDAATNASWATTYADNGAHYTAWTGWLVGVDTTPGDEDYYAYAVGHRDLDRRISITNQNVNECSYSVDYVPEIVWMNHPTGCVYDVYAYATMVEPFVGGYSVFDAYGTPFPTTNLMVAILVETNAPMSTPNVIGYDTQPLPLPVIDQWAPCLESRQKWTDLFGGKCVTTFTNNTVRGFDCNLDSGEVMLRPDWRFGAVIDCPGTNPPGWTTSTTTTDTSSTSSSSSSSSTTDTSTTTTTTTICGPPPP
jgi:hypothetical protein